MTKIDERLVNALAVEDKAYAVVRVRDPRHLNYIVRHFDVVGTYPFIRSVGVCCNRREVEALGRMQEVEFVAGQSRVSALKISDSERSDEYLKAIREGIVVPFSSKGLTGAGVNLCVMDTGVNPHSDLSIPRDRILHFSDLINGREYPYDDNGHGTFVAGVAAGNGLLSGSEVRGIAPESGIIGLKVITASGETGAFKVLDGMQWLFDNFKKYDIKVVCMSFGADPVAGADPLKLGAEMLTRSGLTVVCASGNSGEGTLKSPAISPEVIAVGAVDENSEVAEFSSRGVYQGVYRPDVYAKGVKIKGIDAGGTYCTMTGTSVSAPYIAGACCLLYQKYKNLTPREVKQIVLSSSRTLDGRKIFSL